MIEPVNAVVRIKIPKIKPEVMQDDEGQDIIVEYTEDQIDEFDDQIIDDKVLTFETIKEDKKIWVLNHLAAKTLRTDIANEFRAMVEKLENLDGSDFAFRMEKEAKAFEEKFIKLFDEASESNAPKIPVFSYRPEMP